MTKEQLIESYRKRIDTINQRIEELETVDFAAPHISRIIDKREYFKTFITELEQLND